MYITQQIDTLKSVREMLFVVADEINTSKDKLIQTSELRAIYKLMDFHEEVNPDEKEEIEKIRGKIKDLLDQIWGEGQYTL